MRAGGKVVSIAQLCRWFGVPRSTFYYREERPRTAAIDQALVELVRRLIAENPELRVAPPDRARPAGAARGRQPQADPSHPQGERLADSAEAARPAAAGARLGVPRPFRNGVCRPTPHLSVIVPRPR